MAIRFGAYIFVFLLSMTLFCLTSPQSVVLALTCGDAVSTDIALTSDRLVCPDKGLENNIDALPVAAQAGYDCTTANEIPLTECLTLVKLYDDTNGPNWTHNSDWLATNTPCRWFGITCDKGSVTKIVLSSNQLDGAIPSELGQLPNLTWLDLHKNQLSGAIPVEVGALSNLTYLSLWDNQLSGAIPAEVSNLSNLTVLGLGLNQLSGPIPPELGNLANLQELYLNVNSLSGPIPPELGNLANLRELYLNVNSLSGSIPSTFQNLSNLTALRMESNQLSGPIPPELGTLTNLALLWLSDNLLEGGIPTELGNLTNLDGLYLTDNQLEGSIPSELSRLVKLKRLYLSNNQLGGTIPSALGNLANLELLLVGGNQLTGTIPSELGNLTNLTHLWLNDNLLRGAIPPEIGRLAKMTKLYLQNNQLSGPIPPEIGDLVKVQELYLQNNQLSGPIPSALGNLANLIHLYLHKNQLSDPIPSELGILPKVTRLYLYDNQLSGTMPPALGNLPTLKHLYLGNNRLSGVVPSSLGNLSSLTQLYLHNNPLSGELPDSLTRLFNLMHLDFAGTTLCEPADANFQTWLAEIGYVRSTNVTCPPIVEFSQSSYIVAENSGSATITVTLSIPSELAITVDYATNDGTAVNNDDYMTSTGTLTFSAGITEATFAISLLDDGLNEDAETVLLTLSNAKNADIGGTNPVTLTIEDDDEAPPPDDGESCRAAKPISVSGTLQEQTFESADDVDWFKFNSIANAKYRVEIQIPKRSSVNADLELYKRCDDPNPTRENPAFNPSIQLEFTSPADGPIYLKLSNSNPYVEGEEYMYQVSVRRLIEPSGGGVLIVAGKLRENDSLQRNIHNVTNRVYKLFQENGYDNDHIHYLAHDPTSTGYDGAATLANLESAINTWAVDALTSNAPFTLYLVDHGDHDNFYINPMEILTPTQLHEWIAVLEEAKPGIVVNVIIEACHAGSFIEGDASISKPGRVVVTSSDVDTLAYASRDGAYFSDHFINALAQGFNLYTGFWESRVAVQQSVALQEPWLDANGNGIHNELADASIAAQRGFRSSRTLDTQPSTNYPPFIEDVFVVDASQNGTKQIRATVQDDSGIDKVWAVVQPPDYTRPPSSVEMVPESQAFDMITSEGDLYTLDTVDFTQKGDYRVVVHAKDDSGLLARPKAFIMSATNQTGNLFLPIVVR
ncbi:leucine-rich repeat domain-containing protein [Chloroflexi bacterium TSY]|nr:leucine-rich repeat domain-containing protein [Chloroflexi bacterium TSY]